MCLIQMRNPSSHMCPPCMMSCPGYPTFRMVSQPMWVFLFLLIISFLSRSQQSYLTVGQEKGWYLLHIFLPTGLNDHLDTSYGVAGATSSQTLTWRWTLCVCASGARAALAGVLRAGHDAPAVDQTPHPRLRGEEVPHQLRGDWGERIWAVWVFWLM